MKTFVLCCGDPAIIVTFPCPKDVPWARELMALFNARETAVHFENAEIGLGIDFNFDPVEPNEDGSAPVRLYQVARLARELHKGGVDVDDRSSSPDETKYLGPWFMIDLDEPGAELEPADEQ